MSKKHWQWLSEVVWGRGVAGHMAGRIGEGSLSEWGLLSHYGC